MIKYIAKLRLLEHGLLEAMYDIDEVRQQFSQGADEEDEDESLSNYEMRINVYVTVKLKMASGSKRDDYKDALVYQARKDLILEFLKKTLVKKCANEGCGAYVITSLGLATISKYPTGMVTPSGRRDTPRSSNWISLQRLRQHTKH